MALGSVGQGRRTPMGKNHFQQRFIAFVDILGFSGIVERMPHEEQLFKIVRDALKGLNRQERNVQKYRRKNREQREATLRKGIAPLFMHTSLQMTAFSDCYVLSGNHSSMACSCRSARPRIATLGRGNSYARSRRTGGRISQRASSFWPRHPRARVKATFNIP